MKAHKGKLYRIYTTPEQEAYLARVSGCVRLVYNLALEQRSTFSRRGRSLRYESQRAELSSLKDYAEFLKEVPHHCLQEGLVDLQKAFDRFFKGISGYPKPRRKGQDDGFRFPDAKQFHVIPTQDPKFVMLHLPKMGRSGTVGALKVRLHRPLEGQVKSVTLNHKAGLWYASFLCEVDMPEPIAPLGEPVGLDRGITVPMMVSNGIMPYVPVPTPRQRLRERRLHQKLSRAQKGSKNRNKAKKKLARHKNKEANRRKDALHKATTYLAKNHSLIVVEDLRIKNMTASAKGTVDAPGKNVAQKSGLNRAILSVGWGMMGVMLQYKCQWYGGELLKVSPHYTSQECSRCHAVDAKSRDGGVFHCRGCGYQDHADLNASKNILRKGLETMNPTKNTTPKDTNSGSACGILCAKQDVESGISNREFRSLDLQVGK